jgi:hypothetical protein
MNRPEVCTVEGCDRKPQARGWCSTHYSRWQKHGDPLAGPPKSPPFDPNDPTDPRHGTTNGYSNHRCRCQRCREAHNRNMRDYLNRHPEQREKAKQRERRRRAQY